MTTAVEKQKDAKAETKATDLALQVKETAEEILKCKPRLKMGWRDNGEGGRGVNFYELILSRSKGGGLKITEAWESDFFCQPTKVVLRVDMLDSIRKFEAGDWIKTLSKEYEKVKAELDKYSAELDKCSAMLRNKQ